eukprot:INCI3623.2.p1 GENE.INCI3623.2~~INCI3623.2.p1  ORF type:complete len:379 (+),score=67.88 INCI3623.2:254-1390(+)
MEESATPGQTPLKRAGKGRAGEAKKKNKKKNVRSRGGFDGLELSFFVIALYSIFNWWAFFDSVFPFHRAAPEFEWADEYSFEGKSKPLVNSLLWDNWQTLWTPGLTASVRFQDVMEEHNETLFLYSYIVDNDAAIFIKTSHAVCAAKKMCGIPRLPPSVNDTDTDGNVAAQRPSIQVPSIELSAVDIIYVTSIETVEHFWKWRDHTARIRARENMVCRPASSFKHVVFWWSDRFSDTRGRYFHQDPLSGQCVVVAPWLMRVCKDAASIFDNPTPMDDPEADSLDLIPRFDPSAADPSVNAYLSVLLRSGVLMELHGCVVDASTTADPSIESPPATSPEAQQAVDAKVVIHLNNAGLPIQHLLRELFPDALHVHGDVPR